MDITSLRSSNKKKYPLLPLGPLTKALGLSIPKPEIHVNTSVKKKKQLQRLKYEDVKDMLDDANPTTSIKNTRNAKTIRKNLFAKATSTKTTTIPRRLTVAKQSGLDNTEPLIDVSILEKQLASKNKLKNPITNNLRSSKNNKLPIISRNIKKAKTLTSNTKINLNNIPKIYANNRLILDPSPMAQELNNSLNVFLTLEGECVSAKKIKKPLPLVTPKTSNHYTEEITNSLDKQEKHFQDFKDKLTLYATECADNKKKIIQLLMTENKENCITSPVENSVLNIEEILNILDGQDLKLQDFKDKLALYEKECVDNKNNIIRFFLAKNKEDIGRSTVTKPKQKTVVFNIEEINSSNSSDKISDVEQNYYSTIKKNFKSILLTPRAERSPKRIKTKKEIISKKVQRQCLLLESTPKKK